MSSLFFFFLLFVLVCLLFYFFLWFFPSYSKPAHLPSPHSHTLTPVIVTLFNRRLKERILEHLRWLPKSKHPQLYQRSLSSWLSAGPDQVATSSSPSLFLSFFLSLSLPLPLSLCFLSFFLSFFLLSLTYSCTVHCTHLTYPSPSPTGSLGFLPRASPSGRSAPFHLRQNHCSLSPSFEPAT